jgi:hypothetical protein
MAEWAENYGVDLDIPLKTLSKTMRYLRCKTRGLPAYAQPRQPAVAVVPPSLRGAIRSADSAVRRHSQMVSLLVRGNYDTCPLVHFL